MDALGTNAELTVVPRMGEVTLCTRCVVRPRCGYVSGLCHRCHAEVKAPTNLHPGSEAKVRLLADRVEARLPLFLPGDFRLDDLVRGDAEALLVRQFGEDR